MKAINSNGEVLQAGGGGAGAGLSAGISTFGNTDGTTGLVASRLVFVGGSNISLSQSVNGQCATIIFDGGAGGGGIHDSASHSGNIFPGDVDQLLGSAFLEFATTAVPAGSGNRARLFAQKKFTETDLFYVDADGSVVALGQDNIITVRNTSGSTILRGQVVYVSGASANLPKVDLARADADATMPAIGLAFEDIPTASNGRVMAFGVIEDVDTSSFSAGDRLFVSTSSAGGLTATQPTWPNIVQRVAVVAVVDAVNGKLLIAPTGQRGDIGIQAVSAGTQNFLGQQIVFSNSNGVSFGLDASTLTASHNGLTSQSNQAFSAQGGSSAFQTLSFSNVNGFTFSNNAGQVQGSYTVPTVTNSSMTVSDAATSGTLARLAFTNLNGVTLSLSTGAGGSHTIVGSHNALTSQSNQAASAANGSFAFQTLSFSNLNGVSFGTSAGSAITASHNGLTSQSNQNVTAANGGFAFQTLSFSNLNGISFGTSAGSAITGSHNAITSQSNQQMTMFATGNTTQSSTGTTNASSLIFNGAGLASVGITNGSVVISVPAGAPSPVNFSAGTTSGNLGSVVFSNSNGMSFGLNGSTITASKVISFTAGQAIASTSVAADAFYFSNANNVTWGIAGSTVTASVNAGGGGFTAPGCQPYDDFVQVVGQVGQGTLQFDPQILPNVSFDRFMVYIQNSNSSNSSGSHSIRFSIGLYTRNASSLSLYTSYAGSTAVTHSGTAGSYSLFSGGRLFPVTFAATSIPGDRYWIAFVSSTGSAGANGSYSNYLVSNINSQYTGLFGVASNASMQPKLGQGYYSASTTALPNSVAFNQIQGTNSAARRFPVIGFGSSTV